eukprot:Pgem_evm1s9186
MLIQNIQPNTKTNKLLILLSEKSPNFFSTLYNLISTIDIISPPISLIALVFREFSYKISSESLTKFGNNKPEKRKYDVNISKVGNNIIEKGKYDVDITKFSNNKTEKGKHDVDIIKYRNFVDEAFHFWYGLSNESQRNKEIVKEFLGICFIVHDERRAFNVFSNLREEDRDLGLLREVIDLLAYNK